MAIDMRRSNLKAEEAALLSGELKKPSWQSRNEGIHERVSFEDTIWGFDLAGGSYYHTPLRVTAVKANSRADKAGIRPGDKLKRINDIDTATLTIQEAHQIILDSGVHLKIAVTAPEDEEDAYFCYEDPSLENGYDSDEERRRLEEKMKKMQVHARVSHYWSLQWPWVSKRRIIYRESNCFMVPSKYEDKNRSKFPTQPLLKTTEDIVLDSAKNERQLKEQKNANTLSNAPIVNGDVKPKEVLETKETTIIPNGIENKSDNTAMLNESNRKHPQLNRNLSKVPEDDKMELEEEINSTQEDLTENLSQVDEKGESKENTQDEDLSQVDGESDIKEDTQNDVSVDEDNLESEETETNSVVLGNSQHEESLASKDDELIDDSQINDDEIINEVLENDSLAKGEEESIVESTIESILSDGEDQINHSDER